MLRKLILMFVVSLLLIPLASTAGVSQGSPHESASAVIGSGNAASCQTEAARNLLSSAVAAGGTVTFNCGPALMTMPVNTNATDQTVVVDGGGLVRLSGEDTRQIFHVSGSGDLTLMNITLVDGSGFAGAAVAISGSLAKATIQNSFLTSNDAGSSHGGAIFNQGTLMIEDSGIGSNITTGFGGAVFNNGGTVTIRNSTLISNQASQGGGIWHDGGSVTVERSAIRSNIATVSGGGIHNDGDTVTVVNTTFYDNRAAGGGGIYMRGDFLTITNATFNRNRADNGGALWNFLGQTRIRNSILANSRDTDNTSDSLNCDGITAVSDGRNIVSDNTCVPNPSGVGDLLSTDPELEEFIKENGGSTRNFMPLLDSPAIDHGFGCPDVDQRGVRRPIGPACDVGSVERGWLVFLSALTK